MVVLFPTLNLGKFEIFEPAIRIPLPECTALPKEPRANSGSMALAICAKLPKWVGLKARAVAGFKSNHH